MAPIYSKFDLGYSKKNIPIPSQKEYKLQLIHSVEKFVRNLRWRAFFFLYPSDKPQKENFGFNSIRLIPIPITQLKEFENRLKNMVRDVVFRPYNNDFQNRMKRDLNDIITSPNIIVAADKTTNNYKLTPTRFNEKLQREIHKSFKKADKDAVNDDILKQKEVVADFELNERVMYSPPPSCLCNSQRS